MDRIEFKGVRTHNLKDLHLSIPYRSITVITGVSGSGKSSLAFDTIFAEGQRRYVESLSAYARQFLERMEKPDVDSVLGILPAIAIESKNIITNARSTVGTQTEINDYLRALFARIGKTFCLDCHEPVISMSPIMAAQRLLEEGEGRPCLVLFEIPFGKKAKKYAREFLKKIRAEGFFRIFTGSEILELDEKTSFSGEGLQVVVDRLALGTAAEGIEKSRIIGSFELAYAWGKGEASFAVQKEVSWQRFKVSGDFKCVRCGRGYPRPNPNMFSFNSPLGVCPQCQGFGRVITIDPYLVIPDDRKSLKEGVIEPWTKPSTRWEYNQLLSYSKRRGIPETKPYRELSSEQRDLIFSGDPEDADYFSVKDFFAYLEKKTYKMHVRIFLSKYRNYTPCPACGGSRLKPEALAVAIGGKSIHDLTRMTLKELVVFISKLELALHEREIALPILSELQSRLTFLNEIGLGYLTLDRQSRTLSGGEAERINLATALGSNLVDTLYVLDEPSVGLHEKDNGLLIRILRKLRDLGNTVVVVEHDRQMIETADEVIDLGPGAGREGGEIVFQGPYKKLLSSQRSVTAQYLSGRESVHPVAQNGHRNFSHWIKIRGAREHNLKDVDVDIPLHAFVVISGVSGSGKSTLLYDVLYNNYRRWRGRPVQEVGSVHQILGWEAVGDLVLVDQSPIGKTPRSNPATYVQAFSEIRKLFASTRDARRLGFSAGHFSFNTGVGRCPVCEGEGKIKIEMHFLADIYVECEACCGRRYRDPILEVRYQGKNIHEVLQMTVDEALEFFKFVRGLAARLGILAKIGLGYLRLGQSATTLSQGEAQRMKLALEMVEGRASHCLYLFDEPTTGLHYHDIRYLMKAFDELLQQGHSIILIEHNMEVIRSADYLIDLGPGGGEEGGEVVFQGAIAGLGTDKGSRSVTGECLKKYLAP